MSNYIHFRDISGNSIYFRKELISAVVIASPLNHDPKSRTFIMAGTVASEVDVQTAVKIAKELESPLNES